MKQYYLLFDTNPNTYNVITYWVGDSSRADFLTKLGDMIIPLGNKKPKNVSRETLKQF